MRKKKKVDEERLMKLLTEFEDKLIIVEGKHDEKALKSLGVKHIIAINRRPLYEVAEIASKSKREIIILTDFDKKGREMEKTLKSLLQIKGKHPNSKLRYKTMSLGKNKIEDFGCLASPDFKEDDIHVKIGTDFYKIRDKSRDRRKRSDREA